MLSTQSVSSHITMVVMGAIPSIKSNTIEMGVKTFADAPPSKITANLSVVENISSSEKPTVNSSSETAKNGAKLLAMQGATIRSIMQGLGSIDHKSNQHLDINSLMTAFENYLAEIKKGDSGIPIHFYMKNITQSAIAKMWINKYYPETTTTDDQQPTVGK
jgi:hypothetical protein